MGQIVPWREPLDWLLSGGLAAGLALALPALVTFAVSVLFEHGENMRFKLLLEPLLLVFVATQAHSAFGALQARRRRGTAQPAEG